MKSLIFTLIGMVGFYANAQSVTVRYEERANIENQLKNVTDAEMRNRVSAHLSKPRNYIFYYEDGVSLYIQEQQSDQESELSLKDDNDHKKVEIGKNSGGMYKNQNTDEFLYEADILGKKFLVSDKLEKYNWQLSDEEKTIGSYNVQKATANINGENVVAWYTLELPIQDGPKDYYGLPGLIIELITENKTYHATTITKNKSKLSVTRPSKGEKVNKTKYQQILKEKVSEVQRGMGNSFIGN